MLWYCFFFSPVHIQLIHQIFCSDFIKWKSGFSEIILDLAGAQERSFVDFHCSFVNNNQEYSWNNGFTLLDFCFSEFCYAMNNYRKDNPIIHLRFRYFRFFRCFVTQLKINVKIWNVYRILLLALSKGAN